MMSSSNYFSVLVSLVLIIEGNCLPTVTRRNETRTLKLEERGGFFEGDMNLDDRQLRNIHVNAQAGLLDVRRRWNRDQQTRFVTVPYTIRRDAPFSNFQHNIIRNALNEIEQNTCLRFVQRSNQNDFVEIFSGNGCWSQVGRIGGKQEMSLFHSNFGGTCVTHGIVIHEFLHALGIFHMQSSSNRDQFVRINHENVMQGFEHNFLRYDSSMVGLFSTSYDFDSIMHYGRNAFSRNGRDTISTLNPNDMRRIGQRNRLSSGDIQRIRNMYNC